MHVKRFKCDFLSSIQQISAKCHENKCKDYHHAKYQQFALCLFTVLNKLKALQLSKLGLKTIKNQSDAMDRSKPLEPKHMKKCKLFARVCSQKVFKCPPLARTHAWRRFLQWSIAVSIMSCRKSGHTTSVPSVR